MRTRCGWLNDDPLMISYHDTEWGVPLHQDQKLFEYLVLDAFQAGLSWSIILKKRAGFRKAFNRFNPNKISKYAKRDVSRLLNDASIIRNRLKIESTIINAQQFLQVKKEFGQFDSYIWKFVGGKPIVNRYKKLSELPAKSHEAEEMSRDLKNKGFTFVGPTICYAFMQASGMVNDHLVGCFRYKEVLQ